MGFFSKKNKIEQDAAVPEEKVQIASTEPKRKSDKLIKPSSPRSTSGRKIVRTVFWVFATFLLLKGALAFAQGNRTINQTIINGDTTPVVSDLVKGFTTDFATEYFTWDAKFIESRNSGLAKFVKDVDSDMALKAYDTKVSSRVTAVEVYSTNVIDPKHIDVTVVVWRDVQPLPDQILDAQGKAPAPTISKKKTYMIVPVTLASDGPVITSLPRFVSEFPKGKTGIVSAGGSSVTDEALLQKGSELADSYLRSWYEGNASQIKYFYSDTVKAPTTLHKSEFTYDKLDRVSVYQVPPTSGETDTYRIDASVFVNSDMGESFKNSWSLRVTLKEGQLYVLSNGTDELASDKATETTSIEDAENPASPATNTATKSPSTDE